MRYAVRDFSYYLSGMKFKFFRQCAMAQKNATGGGENRAMAGISDLSATG